MNVKLFEMLRKRDVGSIGIGAMIVFIAMVLVAGIAASVLIQTSTKLESQAMTTGQETIKEVSSGIAVFDIEGNVGSNKINKLAITVRPRAGSADIDMNETFVELANTSVKVILGFTGNSDDWNDSGSGVDNIFGVSCFPSAANRYGILVLEDADGSCISTNPTINKGDKIMLCIDTTQCFSSESGIAVRKDIWGAVVAEDGSPGVISFTTPASYGQTTVFDLQ
jgi:flagellin FlaB